MSDQEALFGSYHEALIFAYNYADQQYAKSVMARLYTRAGSGRGLIGLDGAGEAGFIMADVRRLSQPEQDVLCVRYTKVKSYCKCCGHEVNTNQVKEALSRLEAYIKTAKYSNSEIEDRKIRDVMNLLNLSLIRSVINEYFGLATYGTLIDLASKYDIHRETASKYANNIKKILRMLERKAENNIANLLEISGKVDNG